MIFKQAAQNTVHMDEPRIWGLQSVNRQQRRTVEREYNSCDPELAELEDIFLAEVLYGRAPYKEVYSNVLDGYEAFCKWAERTKKLRGITFNHEYFVHMYKPLETELPGRYELMGRMWEYILAVHKAIRETNYIPGADMIIGITNFKK